MDPKPITAEELEAIAIPIDQLKHCNMNYLPARDIVVFSVQRHLELAPTHYALPASLVMAIGGQVSMILGQAAYMRQRQGN